jgi:hypothetical protein
VSTLIVARPFAVSQSTDSSPTNALQVPPIIACSPFFASLINRLNAAQSVTFRAISPFEPVHYFRYFSAAMTAEVDLEDGGDEGEEDKFEGGNWK